MVFLEDVVNLPTQQMTNIWMAAHFRKKLKKKDINKVHLGEACEQLHASKTKKPIQLRHYGQCLVGISWLHFKQVEYLHNDCNEAFHKMKISFRKSNVELDPSSHQSAAKDITLPQNNNANQINLNVNDDDEQLILADDELNLSQLMLYGGDDISDTASLLGDISHSGDGGGVSKRGLQLHNADDHEITMQIVNDIDGGSTRKSFGNQSSVFGHGFELEDTHELDIEIDFNDDNDLLEESQAKRSSLKDIDEMTDDDNDDMQSINIGSITSVEQGRGINNDHNNHTLMNIDDNISVGSYGSIDASKYNHNNNKDGVSSIVIDDNGSNLNIDNISITGSNVNINQQQQVSMMDIEPDNQSLHVEFDDNISIGVASVSTNDMFNNITTPEKQKQLKHKNQQKKTSILNKKQKKKKKKNKKKRRKKFNVDKIIEYNKTELLDMNQERFSSFTYPQNRDSLHIWREFPLNTLHFDDLLYQPLSKFNFRKLPKIITKTFELCNKKNIFINSFSNYKINNNNIDDNVDDDLMDPNILIESLPQARNDDNDDNNININDNASIDIIQDNDIIINNPLPENTEDDIQFNFDLNDNKSVLESIVNDKIRPSSDPIFNTDDIKIADDDNDDVIDDIDIDIDDNNNNDDEDDDLNLNKLSLEFNSKDANKLHQNPSGLEGLKLREWSGRTKKMFQYIRNKKEKEFSFNNLMKGSNERDTAAGIFYELLVLKNYELVNLIQNEPYGDIIINKTNRFARHARISQVLSQQTQQR